MKVKKQVCPGVCSGDLRSEKGRAVASQSGGYPFVSGFLLQVGGKCRTELGSHASANNIFARGLSSAVYAGSITCVFSFSGQNILFRSIW